MNDQEYLKLIRRHPQEKIDQMEKDLAERVARMTTAEELDTLLEIAKDWIERVGNEMDEDQKREFWEESEIKVDYVPHLVDSVNKLSALIYETCWHQGQSYGIGR